MKKLFGEIDFTWKKLIVFAILAGVYTAVMALIQITKDTSFRDIAIHFEVWILFGIIIICNSKSPKDSALKCFIFFLISQPLVYLLQVPFSEQGWQLFSYYGYWFLWTVACLPMGFIGYSIKKRTILSVIILLPMLFLLALMGIGYFNSVIENFPRHLLSCLFCFVTIFLVVFYLFDKVKLRAIALSLTFIFMIGYSFLVGGLMSSEFDVVKSLDEYPFTGDIEITSFSGTKQGNAELIQLDDSYHIQLNGRKGGKYSFEITDNTDVVSLFEFYFDKDKNEVILIKKE